MEHFVLTLKDTHSICRNLHCAAKNAIFWPKTFVTYETPAMCLSTSSSCGTHEAIGWYSPI